MVDLSAHYDPASINLDDDYIVDFSKSHAKSDSKEGFFFPKEAFCAAIMQSLGFAPKEVVVDSRFHRFAVSKRGRDDAGYYKCYDDEFHAGFYGNWRTGEKFKWHAREVSEMSPIERERLERVKAERERKDAEERAKASAGAQKRWDSAAPAREDHPYLARKRIQAHGVREENGRLLVPINISGALSSVQSIAADGAKKYHYGAPVAGGYFAIDAEGDKFVICEGFATGATIHEATGLPVLVAFTASNLETVARLVRDNIPDATVIIAADDDYRTDMERGFNPGLRAANKAAEAVGGAVAIPPFDRAIDGDGPTDWNDYSVMHGKDAVAAAFAAGLAGDHAGATGHSTLNESAKASGANWPDPKPIESQLPAVKKLTPDMLPESICDYVFDVADRQQSPVDFVAVAALCGLATLAGNTVRIKPKRYDDWLITPNIWAAIIGRPSAMKSPALKAAIAVIYGMQDDLREKWEQEVKEHRIDAALDNLDAKDAGRRASAALKQGNRHEARKILSDHGEEITKEPPCPRLVVNDATVEKLGELLNQNPRGLMLVRDELPGWLARMQREEFQSERAFYLEAFDGDGQFTYDRIGRGTIHIENCTLSLVGGVQPSRIAPLVRGAMTGVSDDGLVQRLQLAVWPDDLTDWVWTDRKPNASAKAKYEAAFRDLHAFTSDLLFPATFHFSEEAQEMFREWMEEIQKEARSGNIAPTLESHILKMPKTVAALALIFHLVDDGRDEAVGAVAAARALEWADYLRSHAARLYAAGSVAAENGARLIIERRAHLPEKFTARQVERKNWAGLSDRETVDDAIAVLLETHHIFLAAKPSGPSGGRPSDTYFWNPRLKAEG